jgi:hypothetical protein
VLIVVLLVKPASAGNWSPAALRSHSLFVELRTSRMAVARIAATRIDAGYSLFDEYRIF